MAVDDLVDTLRHRMFRALRLASGTDRRTIARYFREHAERRLQVGAGLNVREGWLNTNYWFPLTPGSICLDAARPFPLPDESFDHVYSEHMIEHVPYPAGESMLRECFRVLKPGGRLRISTPDLNFLVELQRPQSATQRRYIWWAANGLPPGVPATPATVLNNFVRAWGHEFIYDRETLAELLERTGFVEIEPCEVGRSDDPVFDGMDHVARMPRPFLVLESMVVEARKPRVGPPVGVGSASGEQDGGQRPGR